MSDPEMTKEELAREQLGNLMLHALKHKRENIEELVGYLLTSEKAMKGLPNFIEAVETGKVSNEQLGQMVRTLTKTAINQAKAIKQLSTFMMILVSSQTFDSAATDAAIKLGKGDEAVRAFAQSKFGKLFGR